MTPLLGRAETGLLPPRWVDPNPHAIMLTGHYLGPSPWAGADRSSPAAFRDSTDHSRCATMWRGIQAYHYRPWTNAADIFYSSGVCPHGYRLEGRGPGVLTGANGTREGNRLSQAVVYLAGDDDPLTDLARLAYLDEQQRYQLPILRDHSMWKPTACAGDPFRAWLAAGLPAPSTPSEPTPAPPQEAPPMVLLFDRTTRTAWILTGDGTIIDTNAQARVPYLAPAGQEWSGPIVSDAFMGAIVAKVREAQAAQRAQLIAELLEAGVADG